MYFFFNIFILKKFKKNFIKTENKEIQNFIEARAKEIKEQYSRFLKEEAEIIKIIKLLNFDDNQEK